MDRRCSYSPAVSPLRDAAAVERLLAGLGAALTRAGGELSRPEEAPLDRPLVHVVLIPDHCAERLRASRELILRNC